MTTEFAEFYAANFQRVAAQLYAYLGDHAEAQDVAQEAFCRAFDRWTKVSAYENAPAWVRQVAWNLATSRLRHLQVASRYLARQRIAHVDGPGPDRVALTRALAALPSNHRLAVVLHYIGQLSTSEIAEQRGVAEGTVRSWLSRGRTQLAEQLVDWDQARTAAFQPDGVEAVAALVKRRRTIRRAAVAALILAVLVPLVLLVFRVPTRPPIIGPTTPPARPTGTPSSAPSIPTRAIVLPGVTFAERPDVRFVDSTHAWLWYSTCHQPPEPVECGHLMARSDDGGKSWHKVQLPQLPPRSTALMFAFDANTAAFRITEELQDTPMGYWLTTDGGATFKTSALSNPPAAALLTDLGQFYFRCPGATGLEDGAWGVLCDQEELAKVGSGRVSPQPPLRKDARVLTGADGRVWLTGYGDKAPLFLSVDNAKTWRELAWPGGQLVLSPDGTSVWTVTPDAFLELVGTTWEPRMTLATNGMNPVLLDKSLWLVNHGSGRAYLRDGKFTQIPELPSGGYAYVLRDGTAVVGGEYVGAGVGVARQWFRVA